MTQISCSALASVTQRASSHLHQQMAPLGTPAQAQSSQWAGEPVPPYHDREDDGGHRGLEDPEHCQAEDLHQREEVDPAQGHVPQEGVVWLVLGRHEEELAAFPELAESARLSQQWGPWVGGGPAGGWDQGRREVVGSHRR